MNNDPSDLTSMSRDDFSRLMRTNLKFRFAMITKRSHELNEEPPAILYDTTIYDPEEYQRSYEKRYINDCYESMRHEQRCKDLGYDPRETRPEQLASYCETVRLSQLMYLEDGDAGAVVLHPAELRRREREEERHHEARAIDAEVEPFGDAGRTDPEYV